MTGAAVNEYCRAMIDPRRPSQPAVRIEFFANDQPPLKADQDIVGKAFIDKFSGLRVNQFCKDNWEEKFVVNLTDKSALSYLEKDSQGQKWAEILKIDSRSKTCRPTHAVKNRRAPKSASSRRATTKRSMATFKSSASPMWRTRSLIASSSNSV